MNLETLEKVVVGDIALSTDKLMWEIMATQTHTDKSVLEVKHIIPVDFIAWRVAEYGLDPGDMDTLIDVMMCEPYITPQEMQPNTIPLWNAPTITDARTKFMELITQTKLKYRISTRGKGNTLNAVREQTASLHPADIGLKALGVIMHRHRSKTQELDPDVFRAIGYLEKAMAMQAIAGDDKKKTSISVDKKGR